MRVRSDVTRKESLHDRWCVHSVHACERDEWVLCRDCRPLVTLSITCWRYLPQKRRAMTRNNSQKTGTIARLKLMMSEHLLGGSVTDDPESCYVVRTGVSTGAVYLPTMYVQVYLLHVAMYLPTVCLRVYLLVRCIYQLCAYRCIYTMLRCIYQLCAYRCICWCGVSIKLCAYGCIYWCGVSTNYVLTGLQVYLLVRTAVMCAPVGAYSYMCPTVICCSTTTT